MKDTDIVQKALDIVDRRITETITTGELARDCGYSEFHFIRIFSRVAKLTPMAYVTRRKLQFGLYDLGRGDRIIDVALKYGFETHAGFTKAFKRCFGYPPSLYRIHAAINRPKRMEVAELTSATLGGICMRPEVLEITPLTVVGFTSRHTIPGVISTHDIAAYWDTVKMNYWEPLTRLHSLFNKSKHCEYTVCFDINPLTAEFTYLLGVGVDNPDDLSKVEPGMHEMRMAGGLYAKFTTPAVERSKYVQSIRETWKHIFDNWLPSSAYLYDEKRYDFEYYDERDHLSKSSTQQMDIYVPIQKRRIR